MMDFPFLLQMAWKSALISGAALSLAAALRSRPAADRAAVLRTGVLLLVLLPVIALLLPTLRIEAWAAIETPPLLYAGGTDAGLDVPVLAEFQPVKQTIWDDPTLLTILAYLGGLLAVTARLLTGMWTLRSWTESAREVSCPRWLAVFERARSNTPGSERLRLLVGDSVPSPLSWGLLRPVILIDTDTLDRPEGAEAILAHEMAHVARRDWLVLILSRMATALFWFNPLVWLLEREVVQQAEQAADHQATEHVEPARYAQTLLNWAQAHGAAVPAHGIAPSAHALARRIRAVLDERLRERHGASAWTAVAILACIALAAPVAALELVRAERSIAERKAAPTAHRGPAASAAFVPLPAPEDISKKSGPAVLPEFPSAGLGLAAAPIDLQAMAAVGDEGRKRVGAIKGRDTEAIAAGNLESQPDLARLQAWHTRTIGAARSRSQSNLRALKTKNAETMSAAKAKLESSISALKAKRIETIVAAKRKWQADTAALQDAHTGSIAALRREYPQSNDRAFRVGRDEADELRQERMQAADEKLQARHEEADKAFQNAWEAHQKEFQTTYAAAHEAFQKGWRANHETFQTTYRDAHEAVQRGWRASVSD